MTNKERIVKVIPEELRIDKDKIVPEANVFDDLNFDSLDSVQVILEIEKEFDIQNNGRRDRQYPKQSRHYRFSRKPFLVLT